MKKNRINITQNEKFSLMSNNLNHKSPLILDVNYLKQDILFFKNDVLKDLRKLEEKLNIKLNEQKIDNIDQNEICKKKIEDLFSKISHVNSLISDNSNISAKIDHFESFKLKTEENLFTLNSKINKIQKESKDSYYKYEKLFTENIFYPGIIGNNAKFPSFRLFIDFILNNIKTLNEFKEEIKAVDINEFKRKMNSEIQDLKFNINNNYSNVKHIIDNNMKQADSMLNTFSFKYDKKFDENNKKIELYDNKMKDYLNEYENKIILIEKDLTNKFNGQIKEIENLKNTQQLNNNNNNNFYSNKNLPKTYKRNKDDNNTKESETNNTIFKNSEKNDKEDTKDINNPLRNSNKNQKNVINIIKENNINLDNNNNNKAKINDDNNYNNIRLKKIVKDNKYETKSNIIDCINYQNEDLINLKDNDKLRKFIEKQIKEQKLLDSINQDIIDTSNYNDNIRTQTDNFIKKSNSKIKFSKFPLSTRDILYNTIINTKKNSNNDIVKIINNNKEKNEIIKITNNLEVAKQHNKLNENNKKKDNIILDKKRKIQSNYDKYPKKLIFLNNYSITNIPNIEFKKIMLPEPLNISDNLDYLNKTSLSDNCFKTIKSSPVLNKKDFFNEKIDSNKNIFTNINKNKNSNFKKIKNIKRIDTCKLKNDKIGFNSKDNKFESLRVIHIINKDYTFNSIDNFKKINNRSLSSEKYTQKGNHLFIGVPKTNKLKDKFKRFLNNKYEDIYDK